MIACRQGPKGDLKSLDFFSGMSFPLQPIDGIQTSAWQLRTAQFLHAALFKMASFE